MFVIGIEWRVLMVLSSRPQPLDGIFVIPYRGHAGGESTDVKCSLNLISGIYR